MLVLGSGEQDERRGILECTDSSYAEGKRPETREMHRATEVVELIS